MVEAKASASAVAAARAERVLTEAYRGEVKLRAQLEEGTDRTAASIVTARDAGVPWEAIRAAMGGISRQTAVERVRRAEARAAGGRRASYEGTTVTAPDPGDGAGAWGWQAVRTAAEEGARLAGDAERRVLLAENADPGLIVAGVRQVQLAALHAAADAVSAAEALQPMTEALAAAVAWASAAGYLPEGRSAAGE
jgi:hypothetical protein